MYVHQTAHLIPENYVENLDLQYLALVSSVLVPVWSVGNEVLSVGFLGGVADIYLFFFLADASKLILNQDV